MSYTKGYAKGIDVSNHKGDIDWAKVSNAGIEFANMKMTEGGTFKDKRFVQNWKGAQMVGVRQGAYHYLRVLSATVDEQIANIKSSLDLVNFDPSYHNFALDCELIGNEKATPAQVSDVLHEILQVIDRDIVPQHRTLLYFSPNYWKNYMDHSVHDFGDYRLWIANWDVEEPFVPEDWQKRGKSWSWWQHSSKGQLAGVDGDVDLNWVKYS